ncbi:exo-beta-1,4-galactosidase [Pseudopedobacter saltans]|nr:sugar-binding domain-containing protein [Pseudopedobacter saltans]
MKKLYKVYFLILLLLICANSFASDKISLSGEWKFQIDAQDVGVTEKWFEKNLPDKIRLPGSMAENNKGDAITLKTQWTGSIYDSSFYFHPRLEKYRKEGNIKIPFWLTPQKHYVGAAWYQKEVVIPKNWSDKRIVLFLEQPHTETILWVNGKRVGLQNSMVQAHAYDISKFLQAGKNVLTIRIDNRIKEINVGQDSHSLTDHTQGNWNGINGRMELQAGPHLYFDDLQVYPSLENGNARVNIKLGNEAAIKGKLIVELSAKSFNSGTPHEVKAQRFSMISSGKSDSVSFILPMDKFQTWDEFNPVLYEMEAKIILNHKVIDVKKVQFGMREFRASGRDFLVNGRKTFLRGTVDNAVFPLTGYPDTDVESWKKILEKCKAYGLNHVRFHSWCPPEAAFIAADLVGMYLQPEGPSWANHGSSLGDGKPIDQFIYDETNRMAKQFGNYASFCMLAYGNEPRGRQVPYLTKFVDYWKAKDSRRLYTGASVGGSWPVIPNSEFMVRAGARGLDWQRLPESISDFRDKIKQFDVPFVAHEMGQYCVFPNFKEIDKYTGVYRAKNFELFQEDLADHNMAGQAEDFLYASGKLQALCYKYEIERALRTPGYSGFQLLSLNDYPGQGTALVGVLDAFWAEKGYIDAKEFTRFCNATVPLTRIPKFVFTNDEKLTAQVEVAHFGPKDLKGVEIRWVLKNPEGLVYQSGKFERKDVLIGNQNLIGNIAIDLSAIHKAHQLNLEVAIAGTSFKNDWDVWVYPTVYPALSNEIYYTTELDEKAKNILENGGKVFFNASGKIVKGKEVVQHFLPVFWNTSWFKMRPPHTLGIVLNEKHKAFEYFPTKGYGQLQWWEILNKAQVMNLEDFPAGFRPLVQPIDTWFMNRRLAQIFEAKVGKGKIIVSSTELSSDVKNKPVARQLYYSLYNYMCSEEFKPIYQVDWLMIKDLLETPSKQQFDTFTKGTPDELKPNFQKTIAN